MISNHSVSSVRPVAVKVIVSSNQPRIVPAVPGAVRKRTLQVSQTLESMGAGVGVMLGVGVIDGVKVMDGVGVIVGVSVGVKVAVGGGVSVAVGVAVKVGEGVGVMLGVGVGTGVSLGRMTTTLYGVAVGVEGSAERLHPRTAMVNTPPTRIIRTTPHPIMVKQTPSIRTLATHYEGFAANLQDVLFRFS